MKVRLWLLCLLVLALLAGCGKAPRTPEAAVPVAKAFLDARANRDAASVHDLLTPRAKKALTREAANRWVRDESVTYDSLGAPVPRDEGWVQVPVRNLVIRRGEDEVRWPETRLTLHHDGARWVVAWAEPLITAALRAYQQSDYIEELQLGRTIAEIDPYHYRGYLEQHYAYRALQRPREAELWLVRAREAALGAQLADVDDALARFKLELGLAAEAAVTARRALEGARAYIPGIYSRRWEVDTMVVLGRALLTAGDRPGAEAVVKQALEIDPMNGALAVFRSQLAAPTPGKQPQFP